MQRRTFLGRTLAGAAGGLLLGPLAGMHTAFGPGKYGPGKPDGEGMILIPAGPFLMGTTFEQARELAAEHGYYESWITCESPRREIHLPAFRIDQYPVTNQQYYRFCQETGRGHHRPSCFQYRPSQRHGLCGLGPGETGSAFTRVYFVEASLVEWYERMTAEFADIDPKAY